MRLPSTRHDVTGWALLQRSKDGGHVAKDKPRDGTISVVKHHLFLTCANGNSSLSFRPRGFIYLVSFTVMCSAAVFGDVFTFFTQNINPAGFKKLCLILQTYFYPDKNINVHLRHSFVSWCLIFILPFEIWGVAQSTEPILLVSLTSNGCSSEIWLCLGESSIMMSFEAHWGF